ncbi:MAG TPA: PAS domain-containing sensor histidine kinase [Ramlibacter sp.]|nr:PAS domain-containing sensor histidine kinase [Ramlibacter sp.]
MLSHAVSRELDFAELASTFAAAPVGLAVFDRDGRYVRVNEELCRINGVPADQHLGRLVYDVVPGLGEQVFGMIQRIFETGETLRDLEFSGETRREPGVLRHWISGLFPVRDGSGAVVAVGCWVTEITERKRAEAALEASRLQLAMSVQAAGLVLATIDYRSNENHLSAELVRLMELGEGPMVVPRQVIFDRIHPEDRQRYLDAIARTIDPAGNGHLAIDVRALLPSGQVRWLHILLQVTFSMVDGELRPDKGYCAAHDVTAERLAAQQLREADRRKDEFIATLAHELRNLLAPIRNGLEILRRTANLPAGAVRIRDIMDRQLRHLVRLVDDLLDVSRISRGKVELRPQDLTLDQVVEHALEAGHPAIEAARHTLSVSLPKPPARLHGDLTRLAQIVGNLLSNATKYTPPGGRIDVTGRVEGGEVVLEVADNGIGIAPENLPRVFDLFSQVDRTLARTQGGLGIGLWLVKQLVELHHGRIEAFSEGPDRGSLFRVRLPLT